MDLQQLVNGLILGHSYALIAVGWTLLLGVARLVNFGHGQVYMIAAFTTWFVISRMGLSYFLALPLSVLVGVFIGFVMQRILQRLTLEGNLVSIMLATLGFGHVLHGIGGLLFGSTAQFIVTPLSERSIFIGDTFFTLQDVAIVVATIAVFVCLKYTIDSTRIGRIVRAIAEDPKLLELAGVNIKRVYLGIFVFEGASVALAAALVAPRNAILTSMGLEEVIMTFLVVVFGGVGSIIGSYIAGLALGMFIVLFGALVSPLYATAAAFLALIALLTVRPGGLSANAKRVG